MRNQILRPTAQGTIVQNTMPIALMAKLRKYYLLFSSVFFEPRLALKKLVGWPFFARNLFRYAQLGGSKLFPLRLGEFMYATYDRFGTAGATKGHYFHQDLWAARWLFERGVSNHIDVGSRVDGFVAHILAFCQVCYVDIRDLKVSLEGLEFRRGAVTAMPFASDSLETLSCLHVIEHVGLGRYGDSVDPEGYIKAARELSRVVKPGGALLISAPVGRERLVFDAHRVFDPQTLAAAFLDLQLEEFSLIDDEGLQVINDASFEQARRCEYGCGLFVFRKQTLLVH